MSKLNLNKEQTKKIALGAFGLIALLYVYFAFFLGPLSKSRHAAELHYAELQQKIATSKSELDKARHLEDNARTATKRYESLRALSPEGAPIAWFPPRMKTFFASQQIDHATTRLESTTPFKEKEFSGWGRYIWIIDLPQADFQFLGNAIAQLENTNPLLCFTKLHIQSSKDNPEYQQVSLAASLIIDTKK